MPAFEATPEQRRTVRAMAGFGVPQDEIANFLDIDPKTLRKHFRVELDRGSTEATTKVAQSLFRMATEGNNVAAAIFWMKARAGWSEKQRVEHGLAPNYTVISGVPRADDDLTDEELMRIAARGRRDDDEDDEPSPARSRASVGARRGYVLDAPPDLTSDEWIARHKPRTPGDGST